MLSCFLVLVLLGISLKHVNSISSKRDIENVLNNQMYSFDDDGYYQRLIAENYIIRISSADWASLNKTSLTYKTADDFLKYCAECITFITERTGKEDWVNKVKYTSEDGKAIVTINIKEYITSRTSAPEGIITLNKDVVEIGFIPIEHELTHLVMGVCDEGTLSEGFACYMAQTEFGVFTFPEYELDPDTVTIACMDNQYKERYEVIIDAVGCAHDSNIKHREDGNSFYVFAYSYTKYLINTYGIDAVIELYDDSGSDEAYRRIIGKKVSVVKSEWLLFLEQQDSKMNSEEVFSYISQQYELHQLDKVKVQ